MEQNPGAGRPVLLGLDHIKTVGFLPWNKVPDPELNYAQISDPECEIKMREGGIKIDRDSHRVIRPTMAGCFNATKRFDKDPDAINVDDGIFSEALERMLDHYKPYFDTCPLMEEEKMEWNFKSSCGHYFKYMFGLKRTDEIFASAAYIDELRKFSDNPIYPTLWTAACKEELLPMQKIKDNIPRTFIIPDKREQYHAQRLIGTQHELFHMLSQRSDFVQSAGYAFQHGGFARLMELFKKYPILMAGDVSKWDASLKWRIFYEVILPLRTALYKPPTEAPDGSLYTSDEREQMRMDYRRQLLDLMYDMVHAYVVLPNGQVIKTCGGMKSGYFGTSDDNTLYHEFITYVLDVMFESPRGMWWLMSDDHLAGLLTEDFTSFELRKTVYKMFDLDLKEAADLVTASPEGQTFLGFKAKYDRHYGCYVPTFDTTRLVAMMIHPSSYPTPARRFMRLNAARILAYFTPLRDKFANLTIQFYTQGVKNDIKLDPVCLEDPDIEELSTPWTNREVENLWLGHESSEVCGVGLLKILSILENDENSFTEKESPCSEKCQGWKTLWTQA